MSAGTRPTRSSSTSKTDEAVSVSITASEVEAIVQKAISVAIVDITNLFNSKLAEMDKRISAVESAMEFRILAIEERLSDMELSGSVASVEQQAPIAKTLTEELNAVRSETRESLLASNDNEQYSRRNNLRLCGLKPVQGEDCRLTAAKFIRETLHVTAVTESDIEVAHMTVGSLQSTSTQQKRPTMLVRFCRRDKRDLVIRSRRSLKGTHYAVTEDLTSLNVKTMNRLRNSEHVRNTWSWNGKIFALLSNGNKVSARPFQPISELLNLPVRHT